MALPQAHGSFQSGQHCLFTMLVSLFVKDFAVVGEAEINFSAGLTVVTGETGAGKSLLVDALLLLSGGRADASVVRYGKERTELIAEFDISNAFQAMTWLKEEDLDDGSHLQLRRIIRAEGSSKSYINGRPVTLTQLSTLGERLIEIHGQHEHQALLERHHQLALLDAYGRHAEHFATVETLAQRWHEIQREINQLSQGEDHTDRIAWLEHQLKELDQYALSEPELDALNETHKQLAHAGQLLQGTTSVANLLDGEHEFALLRLLARGQSEISRLSELDPRLSNVRELLEIATIQLNEASDSLSRYQQSLELDPERLNEIEAQLSKLHELARKHRVPIVGLKARVDELKIELQTLQSAGTRLVELRTKQQEVQGEYKNAANRLSEARSHAAHELSNNVSSLMGELGMTGGKFEVALEALISTEPDPHGIERVEFLVTANPGQPLRPLRKTASGGELSRISLAIEVAALGLDDVSTMVFDEVDSGIGGAVAEVVGRKLRELGSQRQVLCVTHLPQVAAQGHQHLCVIKSKNTQSTETTIVALDEKSRVEEIARMLGGVEITSTTLAHAKQMLEK